MGWRSGRARPWPPSTRGTESPSLRTRALNGQHPRGLLVRLQALLRAGVTRGFARPRATSLPAVRFFPGRASPVITVRPIRADGRRRRADSISMPSRSASRQARTRGDRRRKPNNQTGSLPEEATRRRAAARTREHSARSRHPLRRGLLEYATAPTRAAWERWPVRLVDTNAAQRYRWAARPTACGLPQLKDRLAWWSAGRRRFATRPGSPRRAIIADTFLYVARPCSSCGAALSRASSGVARSDCPARASQNRVLRDRRRQKLRGDAAVPHEGGGLCASANSATRSEEDVVVSVVEAA